MININQIEKKLKFKFLDKKLLKTALTHKSHNSKNNYEKLEFVGDRVLGLVIANKLLELYPNEKEGSLDKKLANLVNKKTCFQIGKKIDIDKYIIIGNGINPKEKKNRT